MKVSVLAVAAMVITSVNAGWTDGAKDWLKRTGDKLKSALTLGSSGNGPVVPKYSEATRNRGGYGLCDSDNSEDEKDDYDIYDDPVCDSMLATLRGLRKSIYKLSREHSDGLSALCKLKDGESRSESLELKAQSTFRDFFSARMRDTKKKVDVLKERYTGVLEEFLSAGCSTKVHNPMPLKKVDDLKNSSVIW
ncbi:hypothetical protein BASA50_005909 [Batrachochytrium salamandrivorans]|uniref:Uncharacterized protein n=1 Tax=Batrachochytrium salamandrivorans TaxID=1357716 RepID=A0ABQ8FBI8_9FUNG|nr:hypothetical protein BASA50_005909 [Batrachochytrium salamandrivorans]